MHIPPITMDDRPPPPKRACYAPNLLPATISVASEKSISNLTTSSDFPDILPTDGQKTIHVLKKGLPVNGRVHRGCCCRKHGQIWCYKKTRFYCSTCSGEEKKFYYCQGFSSISLATSNWFLEHQHYMSLGYGWLLCLSHFHPLLYLLNLFCDCFLSVPLITTCIVFFYCLNACDECLVR